MFCVSDLDRSKIRKIASGRCASQDSKVHEYLVDMDLLTATPGYLALKFSPTARISLRPFVVNRNQFTFKNPAYSFKNSSQLTPPMEESDILVLDGAIEFLHRRSSVATLLKLLHTLSPSSARAWTKENLAFLCSLQPSAYAMVWEMDLEEEGQLIFVAKGAKVKRVNKVVEAWRDWEKNGDKVGGKVDGLGRSGVGSGGGEDCENATGTAAEENGEKFEGKMDGLAEGGNGGGCGGILGEGRASAAGENGDGSAVMEGLPGNGRNASSQSAARSSGSFVIRNASSIGNASPSAASVLMAFTPISTKAAFDPAAALAKLKQTSFYTDQAFYEEIVPKQDAVFAQQSDFVDKLPLRAKVPNMYLHQTKAIEASLRGEDVLLLTGTSSGKTLCFASVIAQRMKEFRSGLDMDEIEGGFISSTSTIYPPKALILYPTKALAQDQLRALQEWFANEIDIKVRAVDGDSTKEQREEACCNADVVLSNFDFVHAAILKNHVSWKPFLDCVKLVVLDEAHAYNGGFGSHTACVLRRLQRFVDSASFFLCSATVCNPKQMFERLIGSYGNRDFGVTVVDEDCSPRGMRLLAMWNPPLMKINGSSSNSAALEPLITDEVDIDVDAQVEQLEQQSPSDSDEARRLSPIFETARVFCALISMGARTLAFCKTRKLVELVLKYCHDELKRTNVSFLIDRVAAYRGGYTKRERRDIEKQMFSGNLLGIVATSALELGVDIGNLDAVVVLGCPSTSSAKQMFGRCGRGGRDALNIVVLFNSPLDREVVRNPAQYFRRPLDQSAVFDPANEIVLRSHLLCGAVEESLDLTAGSKDWSLFGCDVAVQAARSMAEDDLLIRIPKSSEADERYRVHPKAASRAHDFGLRVIDNEVVSLVNENNELLDEIEYSRAFFEIFPGAVYLHQSQTYIVNFLDLQAKVARAKRAVVNYYTSPMDALHLSFQKTFDFKYDGFLKTGVVRLSWDIKGYRKRRFHDSRNQKQELEVCPVTLPKLEFSTRATWIDLMQLDSLRWLRDNPKLWGAGVHAAQHLLIKTVPLICLSHFSSVATTHAAVMTPHLVVFDRDPGGIGIADVFFDRVVEVVRIAFENVSSCDCRKPYGCGNCTLDSACPEFNSYCSKSIAKAMLKAVYERLIVESASTLPNPTATSTPEKKRLKQLVNAKRMGEARANGSRVSALWKRHLQDLGSEFVNFEKEV